ncbi:hypothetical protein A2_00090 [Pseudomonas phage BIM BV-45]|nr:hypothetical protein A2_00090 [Pseudomonas phage BIM BV-45]
MHTPYDRITRFDCDSTAMAEACAYAVDALAHADSLEVELDPTPEDALYREGFDSYTGVDTALSGAHESAMLEYGFALLNDEDA